MIEECNESKGRSLKEGIEKKKTELAESLRGLSKSFRRRGKEMGKEAAEEASRRFQTVADEVGPSGRKKGKRVLGIVKENPIPIAMAGFGLGWLMVERIRASRRSPDYGEDYPEAHYEVRYTGEAPYSTGERRGYYTREGGSMEQTSGSMEEGKEKAAAMAGQAREAGETARERARELRERARQRASEARERAARQVRRAGGGVTQFIEDYPLLAGLAAAALGAAVGMIVPESRREQEILGEPRDEFVERTKEAGRKAVDEVRTTLQQAGEAAKEEVQRGLERASERSEEVVGEEESQ